MINLIKRFGLYFILLLSISLNFIQRSCDRKIETKSKIIYITTKEQTGSIKESTIKEKDGTANKIQYKDRIAYVDNPITQKQLDLYIKENDSLKRLKMYGDAITINKQINTFEDDKLKIDIESEIQGKLLELSLTNYTIKSQDIPLTIEEPIPKETKFALYTGGGLYYNSESQKLNYKAGVTFQNKKGDLLTLESDFKKQPIIFIDYKIRIFNYKK